MAFPGFDPSQLQPPTPPKPPEPDPKIYQKISNSLARAQRLDCKLTNELFKATTGAPLADAVNQFEKDLDRDLGNLLGEVKDRNQTTHKAKAKEITDELKNNLENYFQMLKEGKVNDHDESSWKGFFEHAKDRLQRDVFNQVKGDHSTPDEQKKVDDFIKSQVGSIEKIEEKKIEEQMRATKRDIENQIDAQRQYAFAMRSKMDFAKIWRLMDDPKTPDEKEKRTPAPGTTSLTVDNELSEHLKNLKELKPGVYQSTTSKYLMEVDANGSVRPVIGAGGNFNDAYSHAVDFLMIGTGKDTIKINYPKNRDGQYEGLVEHKQVKELLQLMTIIVKKGGVPVLPQAITDHLAILAKNNPEMKGTVEHILDLNTNVRLVKKQIPEIELKASESVTELRNNTARRDIFKAKVAEEVKIAAAAPAPVPGAPPVPPVTPEVKAMRKLVADDKALFAEVDQIKARQEELTKASELLSKQLQAVNDIAAKHPNLAFTKETKTSGHIYVEKMRELEKEIKEELSDLKSRAAACTTVLAEKIQTPATEADLKKGLQTLSDVRKELDKIDPAVHQIQFTKYEAKVAESKSAERKVGKP